MDCSQPLAHQAVAQDVVLRWAQDWQLGPVLALGQGRELVRELASLIQRLAPQRRKPRQAYQQWLRSSWQQPSWPVPSLAQALALVPA